MTLILTDEEKRVLFLLAQGFTNKEISAKLSISDEATKIYLDAIYKKLDVNNRVSAMLKANEMNIPDLQEISR